MSAAPVLFETLAAAGGKQLGVATLNAEQTLNSLSLAMIDLLTEQLTRWKSDTSVAMVVLKAQGERAFSAGGDIQDLYESMVEHPGGPNPYADAFFEREYRLDYLIHTYPKPVLVWAQGFVMGGGLGVMAASSHRVGTEQSRIAMPEITIGLFPDAGATWFLAHMQAHLAYFIAWTGCHLNALDARRVGLIDYLVRSSDRNELLGVLQEQAFSDDPADNRRRLARVLEGFTADLASFPESQLARHDESIKRWINASFRASDPATEFARQLQTIDRDDKWLARAAQTFMAGSPVTAHIIVEQVRRARGLTLKQTFMLELAIAIQCSRHPDFAEGIRALLIDRDNHPRWQYPALGEVPSTYVEAHFVLPGDNPLQDLEEQE